MPTRDLEIVVARYQEDVSWTSKLEDCRVTIYSKTPMDGAIILPNIGREAHTYLHHIIERYDNLAEHTLFTQGNPFDHCKYFLTYLESAGKTDFLQFSHYTAIDRPDGYPHFYKKERTDTATLLPTFFSKLFKDTLSCPPYFEFAAGALFCASRSRILRRPKVFYQHALELLDIYPDSDHRFGWAWMMERMWSHILDK